MNARQHNGALSTRDTDNPMLIGDELTDPHERGDVTALGASRLQVPHAHRSVTATHRGEQLSVHGVHGTHCRPAAEWAQPGRRRPVDNWRIRQPVASRTHRSVTDAVTQNCHRCPETSRPAARAWCPNPTQRSPTTFPPAIRTAESRGFVRRAQYSLPPLYPIWTLPITPGSSARLEPHGRPFAGVTVARTHPDPDGTPHIAPPPVLLVDRHGVVGLARHRPTRWLDRGGKHAPTAWFHEHGYLSLPPVPTSVAAGQTHISHPVSGPWAHVPTWILAAASLPGLYGIVRGITLWPDLPGLPRRRAWLGWTQVALTVAFVAVCLVVAWPKA